MKQKVEKPQIGHAHESLKFPKDFLWGTATSAHQVEGNNTNTNWWIWEQKKGNVKNNDHSGKAADQYNRYEEDFNIAEQHHQNAHRLSIEWSRIEPEEGKWNRDAVEHYRSVLQALKKRKMHVMLTLHHFTNPAWLEEMGGWENSRTPELFTRYAAFVAEQLGEYVDTWVTINEPMVYIAQSYIKAVWPPQKKSYWSAVRVFRNFVKGHSLAYAQIHLVMKKQEQEAMIGIAKSMVSLYAYRNYFLDFLYVRFSEFIWNELFFRRTKGKHDFIGVNYYFHQRIRRGEGGFIFVDVKKEHRESSDLGWEVFAPGLFDVLIECQKYGVPIIITENGIATVNDDKRARFIVAHVKELYHAIQAGVNIIGYYHWSLLDNFEWSEGYTPQFGLVAVDRKSFERHPKSSVDVYSHICKHNAITHSLMKFLGHGITMKDIDSLKEEHRVND